jgi:hypothetical protein
MLPSHFILKMEILLLSETCVSLYQTTYIFNQDNHMNHYHSENFKLYINPLNTKLNPICHLLALLGAHPILHVSRVRVNMFYKNISNSIFMIIFAEACRCTLLCNT